jgi:predicted dehydrogenase
MTDISKRNIIQKSTTVAAFTVAPSTILGKSHGHIAPSDKLNIAVVGIGGMGISNIKAVYDTENIVALCDVDWKYSKPVLSCFSRVKKYKDFRKMYDEMNKDIDAVIVATPDHTHAIIAATAMTLDKHVYVQKPLTHSVYESRLLTKLAAKYNVATQMGNQGSSDEGVDLICEWIWNGEIGEIKKVEVATNRPMWPQGLETPSKEKKSLLRWIGICLSDPAKMRPYHSIYPDFGTG